MTPAARWSSCVIVVTLVARRKWRTVDSNSEARIASMATAFEALKAKAFQARDEYVADLQAKDTALINA
jgi:hypothetical protein